MRRLGKLLSVFTLALCAALAALTAPAQADIYKWTDSNGKTHFSDAAPAEHKAQTITLDNINTFADVSISDAPEFHGFYQPEIKPHVKNVVMFSTARCGYCKQARQYFSQRSIAFTEKKIDSDPAAWEEYQQLNATGVPVILVGRKRMNGFSQGTFDQLFYGDKPSS
jgi:glutaredoxin